MARIRTVKPEFYRHEELQELEINMPGQYPMMVFSALWGHCDKHGVFEWKPRQLQLDIIPFVWEATGKHLGSTLEALVKHRFIKTLTDGQKMYGFIPSFEDHQRINGKEKQAPSVFPKVEEMQEVDIGEATGKHLGSTREATETTGREGKGIGREQEDIKECVEKTRNARFIPPPIEDVKAYCQERGNSVDPQKWFDHYSSNGWKVGKNKMVDWKAAVRTWEGKENAGSTKRIGNNQQHIQAGRPAHVDFDRSSEW
jgi:hypothetical protein